MTGQGGAAAGLHRIGKNYLAGLDFHAELTRSI